MMEQPTSLPSRKGTVFLGAPIHPSIWITIHVANRAVFRRCAHSIVCTSILNNVLDLPEVAAVWCMGVTRHVLHTLRNERTIEISRV